MTLKMKRNLAIGGGTAICAALAILIATRFAPDIKEVATSDPKDDSTPSFSVQIPDKKQPTKIETTEIIPTVEPENSVPESLPTESKSEKEKPENTENDAPENLPTTSKIEEENPVEIEKEESGISENSTPEILPTESKTEIVIPEINENSKPEKLPTESNPEKENPEIIENNPPEKPLTDIEIEKEKADFIEDGGIEIEQSLTEPEKEIEPTAPPAPPKIEDEEMLTNPDAEPVYEPEQIGIAPQQTATGTPKHGDRKDGKIYINGFGWVADEGGGGSGQYDGGMYENGNKIGYFG